MLSARLHVKRCFTYNTMFNLTIDLTSPFYSCRNRGLEQSCDLPYHMLPSWYSNLQSKFQPLYYPKKLLLATIYFWLLTIYRHGNKCFRQINSLNPLYLTLCLQHIAKCMTHECWIYFFLFPNVLSKINSVRTLYIFAVTIMTFHVRPHFTPTKFIIFSWIFFCGFAIDAHKSW